MRFLSCLCTTRRRASEHVSDLSSSLSPPPPTAMCSNVCRSVLWPPLLVRARARSHAWPRSAIPWSYLTGGNAHETPPPPRTVALVASDTWRAPRSLRKRSLASIAVASARSWRTLVSLLRWWRCRQWPARRVESLQLGWTNGAVIIVVVLYATSPRAMATAPLPHPNF
jgi:hypothetical protein